MRLSSSVMGTLRGVGAAIVIAGATGCGASVAPTLASESTTNGSVSAPPKADPVLVRTDDTREAQTDTTPVSTQIEDVESIPAPCGRG